MAMESLKKPQAEQSTAPAAQIDGERLKKLLKGERTGNIAIGACAILLIYFAVRDIFIENAKLMHPEKDSLTFYCRLYDDSAEISVNNYKEKILFDFSAFKKLSPLRKSTVAAAITTRLCVTFLKLNLQRGAKYSSVCYTARAEKRGGKRAFIINGGKPDKKALKIYYKNK